MMLKVLSVIVSETQKPRVCGFGIWASGRTKKNSTMKPWQRNCETACEKGWQAKYRSPPPVVSHLTMQNACSSYSRLEMLTESMKPRNTLLMRVTLCRNSKTNTKQWYVPQRVACFTFVHLAHVQNRRL